MANPKQQVSQRGARVLLTFVLIYLGIGSYMYLGFDFPVLVYVVYGVASWVLGMMLFYRLHRSFIADLEREIE